MSELQQAINEMRNMRESYDQIGAAAEAYNTGKVELAQNITSKGVQASATETLPELAEKVSLIRQNTYEIDGGEMFETQLYGAPTSVENVDGVYVQTGGSLWNLYEVMAQLKSDARFIGYGGILLAEYFKGYETIELMNVGAGGAYFTCDGDFYTTDRAGENTHVWHDDENGMMNRWVAYLFAAEGTNYTIPSTSLCPRSIHIGRKVGTLICSVAGRIREIVVTDGDELYGVNFTSSQVWQQEVVIKNLNVIAGGALVSSNSNIVSLYCEAKTITDGSLLSGSSANLTALYMPSVERWRTPIPEDRTHYGLITQYSEGLYLHYMYINPDFVPNCAIFGYYGRNPLFTTLNNYLEIAGIKTISAGVFYATTNSASVNLQVLSLPDAETVKIGAGTHGFMIANELTTIKAPKSKTINLGISGANRLKYVEVGAVESNMNFGGWNPIGVIANTEALAELNANIRNHIAANVADGNNTLTFTVSTNLLNNLEQATLDAFEAKHWLVAGA